MSGVASRVELKAVDRGLTVIAGWQFACFAVLLLMVWANEILDLPSHVYGLEPTPPRYAVAALYSAFVLLTAVLSVGQTYVKQQQLLAGCVSICARCHKVRIRKDVWQGVEYYIADRVPVTFSHGYCPECVAKELATVGQSQNVER
jgi:hypothetical protein